MAQHRNLGSCKSQAPISSIETKGRCLIAPHWDAGVVPDHASRNVLGRQLAAGSRAPVFVKKALPPRWKLRQDRIRSSHKA
jgi:hypothetical protein